MKLNLHGRKVYTSTGIIDDGTIRVEGSHIVSIAHSNFSEEFSSTVEEEEITLSGDVLIPGLIDLQMNGAGGRSLNDQPELDTLEVMASTAVRSGCTAFLPTVISETPEQTDKALNVVGSSYRKQFHGAQILGVHLEGPFLNPEKAGVHQPRFLSLPSVKSLNMFWEAGQGCIKLLTLAPELPGALDVIREASRLGIRVALGHTMADQIECERAIDAGAVLATHLFNAMDGPPARDPGSVHSVWGVPQFVFNRPELSATVISDGIHVHPDVLREIVKAKGINGTLLVSDSMPPTGTQASRFEFQGEQWIVRDGACYSHGGVLGGSILTMDKAIRNISNWARIPFEDAVAMASYNPASLLGYGEEIGQLMVGKKADIVICDKNLIPVATIVNGEIAFSET